MEESNELEETHSNGSGNSTFKVKASHVEKEPFQLILQIAYSSKETIKACTNLLVSHHFFKKKTLIFWITCFYPRQVP